MNAVTTGKFCECLNTFAAVKRGVIMKSEVKRRDFLKSGIMLSLAAGGAMLSNSIGCSRWRAEEKRPNVILVITDDQGYGDVGCHGNKTIQTPNLDKFAAESTELTRFYVCPTCAPTRAGLLTGRYHLRTGILGVMSGEALIDPGEITLARRLGESGYRTGIFGKWHLGDSYPRRPIDMGFEEAVVHRGGGMSQPAGPEGKGYENPELREKYDYVIQEPPYPWLRSNTYFDPVLEHNGKPEEFEGYCTDIFFNEAVSFVEKNKNHPFFVYLPLNAPHAPEYVSEKYLKPYRDMGLDDTTARCYAMITNIDDNFGRLMTALDGFGILEDTIVIFMCDNGPQHRRYNAGLRGIKGSYYEGGIRAPFFISWKGKSKAGNKIDFTAANIDLFPTILEACGVEPPRGVKLDGRSLLPLLVQEFALWNDRPIFFQGPSGLPEPYNHCAVVTQEYKMYDGKELYDLAEDPGEEKNIAAERPEVIKSLRRKYEAWFDGVWDPASYEPQLLYVGAGAENPVTLTPQDWRGPKSRFTRKDSSGYWLIDVRNPGRYEVTLRFKPVHVSGIARLVAGDEARWIPFRTQSHSCVFPVCELPAGSARLEAWLEAENLNIPPDYVTIRLL